MMAVQTVLDRKKIQMVAGECNHLDLYFHGRTPRDPACRSPAAAASKQVEAWVMLLAAWPAAGKVEMLRCR